MARLIFLLAIGLALYLLFARVQRMPPHRRRGEFIKLALASAALLAVLAAATGKMHWIGAALTGLLVLLRQLLPTLIRYFPMLAGLLANRTAQAGTSSTGQQSTVESMILRMHLDHDSGALQGEVRQGQFQGWRLQDMEREQLKALLAYCQREDEDSTQLLLSYLEQRFPGESPFDTQQEPQRDSGAMTRREALAVLGLDEEADEQAIIDAHRKLMQKMHPDRGGSDYLAAKINQAKDFLLQQ